MTPRPGQGRQGGQGPARSSTAWTSRTSFHVHPWARHPSAPRSCSPTWTPSWDAIAKAKPAAAKGTYFKSATIAHHHGPWHPSEHPEVRRLKVASLSRGNPFLCACAQQKFLPPSIPLGTKFSGEPCTRPDGPRTLSPENFPVCVPAVGACPPAGTDLKERGKTHF